MVLRGVDDAQSGVDDGLAQARSTDDVDGRAGGDALSEDGGAVHGGGEDLGGVALDVVAGELVDDGLRGARGVVRDEGEAHTAGAGAVDALSGVLDAGVAREADAVQVEEGDVVGLGKRLA